KVGEQRGLEDLTKQRESLMTAVQNAQVNFVRGIEDIVRQNDTFQLRLVEQNKAISDAQLNYQKAVRALSMSASGLQMAMDQINGQFKKLGKPEVKVDFGTINIQVDAEIKDRIDTEELKSLVQSQVGSFVTNSCRNKK